MALLPQPTTLPQYNTALSSTGYSSYIPMSSETDSRASNYVSPTSSSSTQVNAYGAPLYQSNPYGTTSQVQQTNPSTGEFQPTPQPGPSPQQQQTGYNTSGKTQNVDYFINEFGQPQEIGKPNQDIMAEVQRAYDAAMGVANQAEGAIRGYQPELEASINRTAQDQIGQTQTSYERGGRQIGAAEEATNKREQNAISAARQTLAEMGMGFGQRFGAASNIAKALGEYSTTKFQQTAGQSRDATQQAMAALNEQKMSLEENYKNTLNSISTWKQNTIAEAQRAFQDKLLEISSMRAAAESEKSGMRIAELQRLQSNIDQAKFLAYQYTLQAKQQASQQASGIGSALAQYEQGLGTNVAATDTANATAQANNQFSPFSYAPVNNTQAIQQGFLTGSINQYKPKQEDLYGIQ